MSTFEDNQNSVEQFYLWGKHRVSLDFDTELNDYYKQKALEELRESPEIVEEGLRTLKELLEGEPDLDLPRDDVLLTRFLRCCKWNAKSAFEKIKAYYEVEANYPQFFYNVTPQNDIKVLRGAKIRHLPYRNTDGSRILVLECGAKWDPNDISPAEALRGISLTVNALTSEPKTQVAGIHAIFDFLDMPVSLITFMSPTFVIAFVKYLQNSMPGRYKGIHAVRQPLVFNLLWAIFKPFVASKYLGRIHFHGNNFASLHKHIDPSVLPKEYGGELNLPLNDPVDDEIFNLFHSHEQRFADAAKYGYVWRKTSS